MKQFWLMKSEPSCFSIDDLIKQPNQTTSWDGVRNYQARNFMKNDMRIGDLIFFYHSNCLNKGISGVMKVVSEPYPDFTAFDPNDAHYFPKSSPSNPVWYMVDVQFVEKFDPIISLDSLKKHPPLQEMYILRKGNRLSITPVTPEEWGYIIEVMQA